MQKTQNSVRFRAARAILVWAALLLFVAPQVHGQTGNLTVHVDRPGVKISPKLYGLMTEEINHSYDGGLYAELIQNRAFLDNRERPVHWTLVEDGGGAGTIALDRQHPVGEALPVSLKLSVTALSSGQRVGVANSGYWGVPVRPSTRYRCSFYAMAGPDFAGPLDVSLESADGSRVHARAHVARITPQWQRYNVTLNTGTEGAADTGRFVIRAGGRGDLYLSLVSLFPPTYHNRQNGSRPDLMRLMAGMKPAFLRFPGGNYLEGNTIDERFDWKKTIGPISDRPGHQGPWGYRSTDGFGLMEFLEWCDDLKMEPILAVFAGYALRGDYVAPGPKLTPYVQDALDEIEYLTGPTSTTWGARRARDGHPAPFKLTYVEIGNEDEFDRSGSYDGRYVQFHDAIKAKYPDLQLIATAPVRSRRPDVIDDHYYRSARDMERDVHHYDTVDRSSPKIFVGEWASTEGSPTPTLQAALGDAAWLTGLERNSDLVQISCYAPLLVNVNPGARQWGTNLIGYDALNSYGSPSYYAQAMFARNRGDVVLPIDVTPQSAPSAQEFVPKGAVGLGTWLTRAEFADAEVTENGQTLLKSDGSAPLAGFRARQGEWSVADGMLRQNGLQENCTALAGSPGWTNYSYHVRARKLSGREGFLVLFHAQDDDNYIWWNIGGWGNTRTALERATNGSKREIGRVSNITVETGRWYDIRIDVQGTRIRCYLDGQLVTEAVDGPGPPVEPIYATASRDLSSGDVIVKVVNVSGQPQELDVKLEGVGTITGGAAQVLQGSPGDVNSIETPERVAPKSMPISGAAGAFVHTFPPYSVTVLRLKTR